MAGFTPNTAQDYKFAKWVFRKIGLDIPEYRTYMDWYWRSNKNFARVGINCPNCKEFVPDAEVCEGIPDIDHSRKNYSIIKHKCGVNLVFVKMGNEL